MKRNLLRIITFAALVVGVLAGCQDDIGKAAVEGGVGREGRRLKSEISVVPMQNDTPTKSLYGGDESVVNNWTLLQFDGVTEKLVAMYYQESGANIGNIKVVAGHPYYWFAMANLGDVRSQFSIGTTTTAGMASWYATGIDMSTAAGLPMSWASSGTVAFTKEQISGGATLDVDMTRMVAKYNVVLDKSGLSVFTFTGATGHQGASIMGPGSVKAFSQSNATDVAATVSSTDGFSSMDIARFYGGNQAVVLYAAENMYGNIESIDTPAKKKASNVGTRKPTYVQVYGQASGDGYENVPLTYRFYLGQNATSNFDVIRNTVSTVTLKLTDDAIRSAIAVANNDPDDPYYPDDPDIWKIESQPVSDTRVLMFNDGVQNGGTGSLSLTLGERKAEALVRTPADLAYQFKMDAALYSAGFRAYTDAAGTTEVDSGYGSDYVTITGAPGTLYFYAPTGISPTTGKVYVKTTDGRKSDELTLSAGRVFDHLEVSFANINSTSDAVSGNFGEWQSADVDKYLYQIMNASSALGAGYGLKIRAVYNDGSTSPLEGAGGHNNNSPCEFSYNTATNLASGASGGYGTGSTRFFRNVTASGETEYRLVRFKYSGTQTETISYTENGVTDNIKIKVTAHVGSLTAEPVSTSSSRILVPMNGSADVKYYWVDNNQSVIGDAAKVDVTTKTASHITIASGETYLQYDGLVGGAARFSGKGVPGTAQANVGSASDYGFINYKDIAEGFGESRDGARDVNIPTSAVQSNTGYHPFSRSYFEVVDNRVLDRLEILPSVIYAPGVSSSAEARTFKLYAHFTDGTTEDITLNDDVVWAMSSTGTIFRQYYYTQKFTSGTEYYLLRIGDYGETGAANFVKSGEYRAVNFSKVTTAAAYYNSLSWYGSYPVVPSDIFTASYTFGGVTKTATVTSTLEDTRTVVALNVTPDPVSLYEGQSQQFTATAVYDTGDEVNVTTTATWSNDANGKLSNNGGGSYTGVTPGTTTVTATYNGVSGSASVTVLERTIQSFEVRMLNRTVVPNIWDYRDQTVNLGSDQDWCILVYYEDDPHNAVQVMTGFELTTTNSSILSVSGTDSHAEAVGTVNVGATYDGKTSTNTVKVTVQSHDYSYELLVTDRSFPNSAEGYTAAVANNNHSVFLAWDGQDVFYAYYVRKDHGLFDEMTDVSDEADWQVDSDLTAANVGSWNGSSQTYTANNTSGSDESGAISAEYSGKSNYMYVHVAHYVEPQYRLVVTLDDSTIDIDETTQATATLYTSTDGGSTWNRGTDVTSSASFSSSAPGKASVASGGTVTGVDTGTAVISATYNGISSSDDPTVTVSGYRIGTIYNRFLRLEVRPENNPNIGNGASLDFSLWCVYEHARRTGGDSFDSWAEDEFEITDASWTRSPSTHSSIDANTGELTNTNSTSSNQLVTVTANAGESRIWWTLTTYGDTPADNLTASADATLLPPGQVITYGGFYITIDDDPIAATGSTSAHAYVKKYNNGSFVEDVDVTTDTDFTITSGGSYASISGNAITGTNNTTSAQTVTVKGTYNGGLTVSGSTTDTETLTVEGKVVGGLSASPDELTWEWNESGSVDGKTVTVTVSDCEISSVSTSSGFSYSRSGNTITVWPDEQNTSTTTDKTGTLTISGTNGASDITVDLTQTKKPAPTLVRLEFDQSHYDLVSVSGGEISLEQSFTLTARYSDGSSVDVTSLADYSDQGSITVDKVNGTLTATSSCSNKVLTGTYQGMNTTAKYSAEDMRYIVDLDYSHVEGAQDKKREFLIGVLECVYKTVFSNVETIEDITGDSNVSVTTSSRIDYEGFDSGAGYLFKFNVTTGIATGTVTFTYTENGISKSTTVRLRCDSTGHVEDY